MKTDPRFGNRNVLGFERSWSWSAGIVPLIRHRRMTRLGNTFRRFGSCVMLAVVALAIFNLSTAVVHAQFTYTTNDGTITITGYTGSGGAVTIPNKINDFPVASIGKNAFCDCTSLTNVTIPNSVTTMGGGDVPVLPRVVALPGMH